MTRSQQHAVIEQTTRDLGREMLERTRAARSGPLSVDWWRDAMLTQLMRDPWLKIQSFRFIDALPTLRTNARAARLLREYFRPPTITDGTRDADPLDELAAASPVDGLRRFVGAITQVRRPESWRGAQLAIAARRATALMGTAFIAGENIEAAERALLTLRRRQLPFTLDLLGEAAVSATEAERYHATYMKLINTLPQHAAHWPSVARCDMAGEVSLPRVSVSVKVTSLQPGFDPIAPERAKDRAKELLRPLLRAAMENGVHLHIDMEHYAIKDLTLALCRELLLEPEFRDYPHVGVVLQAYLREGDRDVAELIDFAKQRGTPLWVRLVKGAYWDSETVHAAQRGWPCPVWRMKWQSDACYERMTRAILENHEHVYGAFASHNVRSLCHALAWGRELRVPPHAFEWQMLYGMGEPLKTAAVQMGQRVRVYAPYGEMMAGMAYLIRRLLENTANESFLRRLDDESADESMIEDPVDAGRRDADRVTDDPEELMSPAFQNTPDTDFARAAHREQMQAALAAAYAELPRHTPLIIAGEQRSTDDVYAHANPSRSDQTANRVCLARSADVQEALAAAHSAAATWSRTVLADRAALLAEVALTLDAQRSRFAARMIFETGLGWRDADQDVSSACDHLRYAAERAAELLSPSVPTPGETNTLTYTPHGVCVLLTDYRGPLSRVAAPLGAALVTGNCVVLAPDHRSAGVAVDLAALLDERGLPRGVLSITPCAGDVRETLVQHRHSALLYASGETGEMHRLHALAASAPSARGFRKCLLEADAGNALIIDATADLDAAVRATLSSGFAFAGQHPTSSDRVFVVEAVYERFTERLVDAAKGYAPGPADEPRTGIPPLVDRVARQRVVERIEQLVEDGATMLLDGRRATEDAAGAYLGPTILAHTPRDATTLRDRIGGPVIALLRVRDLPEAISGFNADTAMRSGGIFSRSPDNIERAQQSCECGLFCVNRPLGSFRVDQQPAVAVGRAGLDCCFGMRGFLQAFVRPRGLSENTLRQGFAPSDSTTAAPQTA